MKTCKNCKETKPFSEFGKNPKQKLGLRSNCKFCENAHKRELRKNNPEITKKHNLKYKYGLTIAEHDNMLAIQNNKCAICEKAFINSKDSCVDHCHNTGNVRKLLCQKCNTMLGRAEDNIQTLKNAIQYLLTHQQ